MYIITASKYRKQKTEKEKRRKSLSPFFLLDKFRK